MNRLERGLLTLADRQRSEPKNTASFGGVISPSTVSIDQFQTADAAMKLSAVDRCVEVLSDSMAKLPIYVIDRKSRQKVEHPLNRVLSERPNDVQTPSVAKKMVEANRNCGGNGYLWIRRSPQSLRCDQLIPIPYELVTPWLDTNGRLWYTVIHPFTGEQMQVHHLDMIHLMAYTHNGWKGISVLQRASEVIAAGRAAQQYNMNYYQRGGQPSGVLHTETDLSRVPDKVLEDGTKISAKDIIRMEWEKRYSGPNNAGGTAVLDHGLEYTPISISNRDAQFVEQSALSVEDVARFFGVPLYKLQAGKQSYSSNEQNAIEYVVSTLHPIVSQWEDELSFKLLTTSERAHGLEIRINMMAELRGDFGSRSGWYKAMREIGAFSVNDIMALEDMPDVEGGDERYASLNYVPLSLWRDLSITRASGNGGTE